MKPGPSQIAKQSLRYLQTNAHVFACYTSPIIIYHHVGSIMVFPQKSAFLFLSILMNAQRCIAIEDIAKDVRIFFIPDISLIKAAPGSYELSLNAVEELMRYARNNLAYKQCMAIYLDTYDLPDEAGFMAFFQKASTPKYAASKVFKKTVRSSEGATLLEITSARINKASPVCSICKYDENDDVFLGSLSIAYPNQEPSEIFAFSPIVSDILQYSVNFNSKYNDHNRE